MEKYQDLKRKVRWIWEVMKGGIIPIVVCAFWSVKKSRNE